MEFPYLDTTNYAASGQKLCDEFTSRLPEFRQDEIKAKLSAHPFELAVEDSTAKWNVQNGKLQNGNR